MVIDRFYSTGYEKVYQRRSVREVTDDIRAGQRHPFHQYRREADAVDLGALGMTAHVANFKRDRSAIES